MHTGWGWSCRRSVPACPNLRASSPGSTAARLFERPDTSDDADAPCFDLDRGEVRSLLSSHALYWIERYHADALRIDADVREVLGRLAKEEPEAWRGVRMVMDTGASRS